MAYSALSALIFYEILLFFHLGSLSNMPAVKTFALYSTAAIFLNFIFQITVFVALMSLDQKRFEVRLPFEFTSNRQMRESFIFAI